MNPEKYRPSDKTWRHVVYENRHFINEVHIALLQHDIYHYSINNHSLTISSVDGLNEVIERLYDEYCMPYYEAEAERDIEWQNNYSDNIRF